MKQFIFGTILFSALTVTPFVLSAQDHDRDDHPKVYYDRAHKDKHEWNANESAAWDRYRDERHVTQKDFARANRRNQQDYWKWRHDHPDSH